MFTSKRIRGTLKVKVVRGYNLAVRDIRHSDPYVVVQHAGSKLKTSVIKKNLNPVWNENIDFSIVNPCEPIEIQVLDKDLLSRDETMGDASVDVGLLIQTGYLNPDDTPEGEIVYKVRPDETNNLVETSNLFWADGKVVQDIILRLQNVECGELELQLQWTKCY
ncbi:C2 domain-containing protein-like [Zostera marina]|uniref:C2 domain-containing protein-like n=1 Tax=Zostera marina TaxID=29655 RepID=A0A0K9PM46_ZOSMR|nr:C2 domain-containing protein-like [Zostera marina]